MVAGRGFYTGLAWEYILYPNPFTAFVGPDVPAQCGYTISFPIAEGSPIFFYPEGSFRNIFGDFMDLECVPVAGQPRFASHGAYVDRVRAHLEALRAGRYLLAQDLPVALTRHGGAQRQGPLHR